MFIAGKILLSIVLTLFQTIINPIFWVVVVIVAFQYKRLAAVKEEFFKIKVKVKEIWLDTLVAVGHGIIGGLIGSVLIVFIGLTLSGSDILYLWPIALLLMLINVRFLCFAYAGGVLALSRLLFGVPQIEVPQILALVAILHMVESILIFISGHLGAIPSYFKKPDGRVVGGFALQKFWPIPIAVLVVVGQVSVPQGLIMPEWWPLIKPALRENPNNLLFSLMPVVAGLGYGDLVIAREPVKKSRLSALFLGVYSFVLLMLALWAEHSLLFAFVAALFSPLGHEMVIYVGKQIEFRDKSIYVPSQQGVFVLDVVPGLPAWQMGVRSRDIILKVNNRPVDNQYELEHALKEEIDPLEITFLKQSEQKFLKRLVLTAALLSNQPFGVIVAPGENEGTYMEIKTTGPLGKWMNSFWDKLKNGCLIRWKPY